MTTCRDAVTRALRIIGVVDRDSPVEAFEAVQALESLNGMLGGWASRGVDIAHTDYASLNDTLETATLTSKYTDHVIYLLARHIAPEFQVSLSREAVIQAADAWRVIQANFLISTDQTVDKGLRVMPSQYWGTYRTRSL